MVFFTDWKSIGCGQAVTRYRCFSSFIAFEALPAEWLVECYNHMTTTAAQNIIQNGWKAAGTTEAL